MEKRKRTFLPDRLSRMLALVLESSQNILANCKFLWDVFVLYAMIMNIMLPYLHIPTIVHLAPHYFFLFDYLLLLLHSCLSLTHIHTTGGIVDPVHCQWEETE